MMTFLEWQKKNEDLKEVKCYIAKTPVSYADIKEKFNITKESYNKIIKEMGFNS